jgi:hypothetical protein
MLICLQLKVRPAIPTKLPFACCCSRHPPSFFGVECKQLRYRCLLSELQVTELFDISQEELFAGSSRRELLSALLAEIQHAHWCAAVGCSPKPAFMTSLTARTAVAQHVQTLNGCEIERATAAAQKRGALLPQDLTVQLQLALLLYFSGR